MLTGALVAFVLWAVMFSIIVLKLNQVNEPMNWEPAIAIGVLMTATGGVVGFVLSCFFALARWVFGLIF